MKTVMILGANIMQVTLVIKAKELGHKVVVCAANDKGPAIKYADKVRFAASDDKEAVLNIAKEEQIDGIISNAPMYMTTVAYVAEKLGLVGNPVSAIEILEAKIPFRKLQEELGLYAPKNVVVKSFLRFVRSALKLKFPIMLKPDMAMSTVGQVKVDSKMQLPFLYGKFRKACKRSLNKKALIEEFVTNPGVLAIEADICVYNGTYLWDGFNYAIRSKRKPLLVATSVFPQNLSERQMEIIKESVKKIFEKIGVVHGQYNLEGYFVESGEFFILEINPRQCGDELSKIIELVSGVDYNRLLIETSLGEYGYLNSLENFERKQRLILRHRAYTDKEGVLRRIAISPEMKGRILSREEVAEGSQVRTSSNLGMAVARYTMEFASKEELYETALKIEDLIIPIIE